MIRIHWLCATAMMVCAMPLHGAPLTLAQAIEQAQAQDLWLKRSRHQQSALRARSMAAGELPDPVATMGLKNIPTDTFALDQEPMTQVSVGLMQMFPRGNSRALKQQKLADKASEHPFMRAERKASVALKVSQLWLTAYQAQQTIQLIETDQSLFQQLVDVASAGYASTAGKMRQQDVIRAQLELVQLEDRLTVQRQSYETAVAALSEWLNTDPVEITQALPVMSVSQPAILTQTQQNWPQWVSGHPSALRLQVSQQVAQTDVAIAEQSYEPQWSVNASYGHRQDAPNGMERADFFSVGVSVDLPLFTERRQDQQMSAAVAESEAIKTEYRLQIQSLVAAAKKEKQTLKRLQQRRALYKSQLLTQMHDQAEAALTAYTNDDGDFAEVVRARIAELNARITALSIDVEIQKAISRLNYYLTDARDASAGGRL
ncbi:hypothetical protein HMF8227_01838 [Saliniradius amylolyticus]|uniref:Cobalt-zinc-cadmium resistance protein CzcC n=1 Tax=Saliniradius amylolyticus TaxID=2183582 RepID=A0A2S2E3T5_9ALTE|nr:TolC family protein [Saliniradius amylolyticus]AWL12311.1 hypothetical protein HMF8227_01838 [Saliniradius amylolyticus]